MLRPRLSPISVGKFLFDRLQLGLVLRSSGLALGRSTSRSPVRSRARRASRTSSDVLAWSQSTDCRGRPPAVDRRFYTNRPPDLDPNSGRTSGAIAQAHFIRRRPENRCFRENEPDQPPRPSTRSHFCRKLELLGKPEKFQDVIGCSRAGLRRGSGNRRRTRRNGGGFRVTTRGRVMKKVRQEPSARQVRPSSPTSGDQHRLASTPENPDALGSIRRGAGRAARADRAAQMLFLVPATSPARTPPLGLRRTPERHLPLRRLPRHRRLDEFAKQSLLSEQARPGRTSVRPGLSSSGEAGISETGSVTTNVVPSPGVDCHFSSPPAWATIRAALGRPRPSPRPACRPQ